jgi:hypothetical protein
METKTLSKKQLINIKMKLANKAIENMFQDTKENRVHWRNLRIDIDTAEQESDLQRIAFLEFGVESLEDILYNKKEQPTAEPKYLIWNRQYVGNCLLFWREGKAGYTTNIDLAHKFTYEEAVRTVASSDHKVIPFDHLSEVSWRTVHADHLNRELIGKEVSNA